MSKYSSVSSGEPKRMVARKPHTCTSCGAQIAAGDTYFGEVQFLRGLSRPLIRVCLTCHNEGRFDLRFLEKKWAEESHKGPIDRYR